MAAATKSPLAPKSDEVKPRDDKATVSGTEAKAASDKDKDKDGDGAKAAKPSKVVVTVDVEGLTQRITVLPPPASNYGSLTSVGDKLFYLKKGKLHLFDLEKDPDELINYHDDPGYEAVVKTLKTELKANRPKKQALAVAYSIQREAKKKGK